MRRARREHMTTATAEKTTRAPRTDKIGPMKIELSQAFTSIIMFGDSAPITALVDRWVKENESTRGSDAWEQCVVPSLAAIKTRNPAVAQYLEGLGAKLESAQSARINDVPKVTKNRLMTFFTTEEVAAMNLPGGQLGGFRKQKLQGQNGRVLTVLEPITPQEYEAIAAQAKASTGNVVGSIPQNLGQRVA